MQKAGQETPEKVTIPSEKIRILRVKLPLEETLELAEASGLKVLYNGEILDESLITYEGGGEVDLELIADSFADINYVSYGGALAYGLDLEPIEEAVQDANMAKFAEGSYAREDGKWMKPPNWTGPEAAIKRAIEDQS